MSTTTTPAHIVKAIHAVDRAINEVRNIASHGELLIRFRDIRNDLLAGTVPARDISRRIRILVDCYETHGAPWWAILTQAAQALESAPTPAQTSTGSYNAPAPAPAPPAEQQQADTKPAPAAE